MGDSTNTLAIAELFQPTYWDVAVLGSKGPKDLDLFVISKNADPKRAPQITKQFLPIARELEARTGLQVITHQEHRAFIPQRSSTLHLLFYPSIVHLTVWELPSFIASVYESGFFIVGSNKALSKIHDAYRKRLPLVHENITLYELATYAGMVVSSLIYLSLDSSPLPRWALYEKLKYALRFSLVELLVLETPPNLPITFWGWAGLVDNACSRFPENSRIISWLKNRVSLQDMPSSAELIQMGFDVLRLCSLAFDAFKDEAEGLYNECA